MEQEYREKMSQQHYDAEQQRLSYLKGTRRTEVADALAEARSHGDLSENADWDAARDKQAQVESRIAELEGMLNHYELIDTKKGSKRIVHIGSTVKIEFLDTKEEAEYTIVGSTEADPLNGRLSNETPLAQAILDSRVGDTRTVDVAVPYDVIIIDIN